MSIMNNGYKSLGHRKNNSILVLLKSILVGFAVSLVVVAYRWVLTCAEDVASKMYDFFRANQLLIPVLFFILAAMGYFVGWLVSKNKMISGSGIPQLKGVLMGYFKQRWFSTLWQKFVGGAVAILGGLSLGREGPSIQLGAAVGKGIGNKIAESRLERKILMASGASAGLAGAFNAPLAGVLFALEEIFKYFSPVILLSTMSAAIVADFVSKEVFGLTPIFNFQISTAVQLKDYWILIILGIILGLLGAFYNWLLLKTQSLYKKINKLSIKVKMIIPFMLAGILGLTFPIVLGGGHHVIAELHMEQAIGLLIVIWIVKFLFSMISFGSGAPGGIFFPLLVLGGIVGAIFGKCVIDFLGFDSALFFNFVILAMAGYFTAIVRAPITGVVLIIEMTGSFNHLLSLTVVSLIAYVVADFLKSPPIYEALLENLIRGGSDGLEKETKHDKKVVIEMVVQHGSQIEEKQIKEIIWANRCLVVGVKRGETEVIPTGDTVIKAGDYLIILTEAESESSTRELLEKMVVSE